LNNQCTVLDCIVLCEYSGSGSTFLVSGVVMICVLITFVAGALLYVEVCRGAIYDDSKGNIFKVTLNLFRHKIWLRLRISLLL